MFSTKEISEKWPVSGAPLDGIKFFAAFFMLLDHVNVVLFNGEYVWMNIIGRATYPLFAFAVAAAIIRGDGKKPIESYLIWLLVFAAVSQPFYQMAFDLDQGNIMITLAMAVVVAHFIERLSHVARFGIFFFGLIDIVIPNVWDFGLPGVFLPAAMVLALRGERLGWVYTLLMLTALNMSTELLEDSIGAWILLFIGLALIMVVTSYLTLKICQELKGDKRLMHRFALHYFYAGHLLF